MNSTVIVISAPSKVPSEIQTIRALLEAGLQQFHVRKPNFDDFDMIHFLLTIPKEYHQYLVLHSHFHLAKEFNLKGIQVGADRVNEAKEYPNSFRYYGYSAHSYNEVLQNKNKYTHFFLSPIFDSVSKPEYKSTFDKDELQRFIQKNLDIQIIALGGINETNAKAALGIGFSGLAFLGSIWQSKNAVDLYQSITKSLFWRAECLSVAGFDPSSGAGVTADIKTFEQHKTQGFGVTTAITYQNENEFESLDWLDFNQIKKQIDVLFRNHNPKYIKIGLIENLSQLLQVIQLLESYRTDVEIIWDPVLKATANFEFHTDLDKTQLHLIFQNLYLLTPNLHECKVLFGTTNTSKIQKQIGKNNWCKILLKGGHSEEHLGTDILIEAAQITSFEGKQQLGKSKHGTGCVLSSAICSNLAKGLSLNVSIKNAKNYISKFIASNNGLLGFHHL